MKIITDPLEAYPQIDHLRREGKRIGLVPTMGALHPGHISLVERARQECDVVVTTIFVNPTQFGPNEDFSKYPRTLESDLALLRQSQCDLVFTPASDRIYSAKHSTYIDPPAVSQLWEGAIRPGHFRGVCTIVLKLFAMLPAHIAYFGRKDYQQVSVLKAMVDDLNLPIRIVTCETIREPDGLAMSSRNRYLSPEERLRALSISQSLRYAQQQVDRGQTSVEQIEAGMREILLAAPVSSIDYATIVNADDMTPLQQVQDPCVAIIAARVGTTRLIDNALIEVR